jgi:YHS domain-containing protein
MTRIRTIALFVSLAGLASNLAADDKPAEKRSPKEALQGLQVLIGSWTGSGLPEGTREEKQKGLWEETIRWEWQFKDKDVFLKATIDKGKYFTAAELRYLPDKDAYQLTATTLAKEKVVFEGKLKDKYLTLDRTDDKSKEDQRLTFSLLHDNYYRYKYEAKPSEKPSYKAVYQVGAKKEGVPFASTDNQFECVVSGGKGTMTVMYKGQTYYVCCSGCRDAFKDDPEKYIKEFEERKKKEKEK